MGVTARGSLVLVLAWREMLARFARALPLTRSRCYQVASSQHRTSAPATVIALPSVQRITASLQAELLCVDSALTDDGPILNEWSTGLGGFSCFPRTRPHPRRRRSDRLAPPPPQRHTTGQPRDTYGAHP
jgi:hypothetical protein